MGQDIKCLKRGEHADKEIVVLKLIFIFISCRCTVGGFSFNCRIVYSIVHYTRHFKVEYEINNLFENYQ